MEIYYYYGFIKELEKLDSKVQSQIKAKLKELYRLSREQFDSIPLKGKQFKGLYKFRFGNWRLIYKIIHNDLYFITLGHRSRIYEQLISSPFIKT